jgi:hypothetical protein
MRTCYYYLLIDVVLILADVMGIIITVIDIITDTQCDAFVLDIILLILYLMRIFVSLCIPGCTYLCNDSDFNESVMNFATDINHGWHGIIVDCSCSYFVVVLFFLSYKSEFLVCNNWIFRLLLYYTIAYSAVTVICFLVSYITSIHQTRTAVVPPIIYDDDHV